MRKMSHKFKEENLLFALILRGSQMKFKNETKHLLRFVSLILVSRKVNANIYFRIMICRPQKVTQLSFVTLHKYFFCSTTWTTPPHKQMPFVCAMRLISWMRIIIEFDFEINESISFVSVFQDYHANIG